MNIRYTDKRTAVITMKDYLREAIAESGLDIRLGKSEGEAFHSVAAKLLNVSLRARVDLLSPTTKTRTTTIK
jgi:hypothetical protein